METHPVLSHIPNHQGDCKILGGHTNGPFFLNKFLKNNNYNYDVIIAGVGVYSSYEELLHLLTNIRRLNYPIKMIISLNGINDLHLQYRNNYFLNERVNEMYMRQTWIDQSFLPRFMPNIFSFIRYFSPKIESKNHLGKRKNNILKNVKKLNNSDIWNSNVKTMKAIADSMGSEYLVFLQPTMGLIGNQSTMPKNLDSNDAKMLKFNLEDKGENKYSEPGYREMLNKNYEKFKEKCKLLEFCIDITNIAPTSNNGNYNDPRHHNENGNELIVKEIFINLISKMSFEQ